MARYFKKWNKLKNQHFYIGDNKIESIKSNKQQKKANWHVIGETSNRQSKYELQNLLFEIDDYVEIEKENNKE